MDSDLVPCKNVVPTQASESRMLIPSLVVHLVMESKVTSCSPKVESEELTGTSRKQVKMAMNIPLCILESQNCRMVWAGGNIKDNFVPTSLLWAGTPTRRLCCSEPPSRPWTLPGMGQAQLLWALSSAGFFWWLTDAGGKSDLVLICSFAPETNSHQGHTFPLPREKCQIQETNIDAKNEIPYISDSRRRVGNKQSPAD